tara:strand:+ start:1485 stop:2387 length:903 start_codon:yes stop_codon:yes gene_type:complete
MSFYHLDENIGLVLKSILDKICNEKFYYNQNNIAVTWINYNSSSNKGYGYGINNNKRIYPASLVKLVYGLAVYSWIEDKRILFDEKLQEIVFNMLQNSSNDATSLIVDLLTGTTSGPSLEGEMLDHWKFQRRIINDWLKELNWQELKGINCCQKTWEEAPYGREKDFYGISNENKNAMTTDGTARIMEEIIQNLIYRKSNINLKNCLFRDLNKDSFRKDPNNQIEGFLGEGLPENNIIWSKAGLMSKVRHDAAWWINNNTSKTLLVVFTQGEEYANDKLFLPKLSNAIYKYNAENISDLP